MKVFLSFLVVLVGVSLSASCAGLKDGLMLYFTFDGDTKDRSGNKHDGELLAGARIDKDTKKNGTGALRIDGGLQAMEVKSFKELDEYQDHTLLFWINFTAPASGSWDQIIAKPAPGSDRSPGLWVTPEGLSIHWRYNPGNLGPWGITKSGNQNGDFFAQNQWYHVAGVADTKKATLTAYVNGKEVCSVTIPAKFDQGPGSFFVGDSPAYGGPAAKFVIDDVAFYNRLLSVNEITNVMNGVLNAVEPREKLTSTWGSIKTN